MVADLLQNPGRIGSENAGQTYKYGNPVTDPFFHDVIEMTGIVSTYLGLYANKVERINVVNFKEFQTAHPEYYGAFKQSDGYDVETRKKILGFANALHEADPQIEYIVKSGEPTKNLFYFYFRLKENQTLEAYNGEIWKIARMRSDAFVEYCYAAAEVPIAKDTLGNPLSLITSSGTATLVLMAAAAELYPDNQRNWLSAADSIKPELIAKDSSSTPILLNTAAIPVTFAMSDSASGPGLLKIEKVPRNSEYGRETFTPYKSELLGGNRILTENILVSTEVGFSPKEGLQSGYDYTATAYDNAGNASQEFNFKIPDLSAIKIKSESPLYDNFKGISGTAPSTLERSHTFEFSEPMAGVSAVSIDGPQGNLWSRTFDPPVFSTFTALSDLPVGDYVAKSFNAVGEETKTPFLRNHHFPLVGNHKSVVNQTLTAKPVNSMAEGTGENSLLCASRQAGRSRLRRTARYGEAYPREAAHAPTRRPIGGAAAVASRLPQASGETHLLCASRQSAGRSRLRLTARYGAAYPRDAAGSPIRRPIGGAAAGSLRLPQVARVAGGRSSGGLPRSPAAFSFPAREKTIKRILHGAPQEDDRGNYHA